MKKTIIDLTKAVQAAKDKQKAAKEECTKLEKDMKEFKENKEGKTDELKVRSTCIGNSMPMTNLRQANISKQKSALQKQAVTMKLQQKEVQTAQLELGNICSLLEHLRCD